MTEVIRLSDLQPDANNANKGTERGRYMVEQSLRKLGAGRSILLDKNGKIIAGNKTAETAGEVGIEDVVIIRTKGDQLVAVLREDLDLDDPTGKARELAYADNRAGQVSLEFDADVIATDLLTGLDLSDWFQPFEINLLTGNYTDANNVDDEWSEMPEFVNEPKAARTLYIHFATSENVNDFLELIGQTITDKTRSLWFPPRGDNLHENKDLRYE